jgi:hypothetical protein
MTKSKQPDYWCVVALSRYAGLDWPMVVYVSKDTNDDSVAWVGEEFGENCEVNTDWCKGLPDGLYKLHLGYDADAGKCDVLCADLITEFPSFEELAKRPRPAPKT